jgi:hypothetical protein
LERGATAIVDAGALHALRNRWDDPLVLRETVRDRVYARAAIAAAIRKRWSRLRAPKRPPAPSPFFEPGL